MTITPVAAEMGPCAGHYLSMQGRSPCDFGTLTDLLTLIPSTGESINLQGCVSGWE